MIHTTLKSWKNKISKISKINEKFIFDFEEFIDTDLNGASQEIAIDSLIEDVIDLINTTIEKEASGTGADIEDVKKQAKKAVAELWIEKIKKDLK